ncbi:trigger factor [Ruminococcus sp.]|uniref:trigger factor n=1 Tax=Ruminococcus sp. TaxID=41978 RepID=UPI0025F6D735|nr:trigger factor [Ruminococcus sp.]MBQ6250918.1 trigger factor [Ruminococcus sp.]MBR0511723.1 trigger factor [Ruminococcus sp.]MBR6995867.1 trigger factor [Ruminococcus sp.]
MSLKSSNKTDVNTTELVISIDAAAFEAAVEKEYQRQKKNIQIKGFRKGKVSRKLAEREFGEGAFYEGAINSLLGPEIDAAVKETGLVLVDRPNVEVTSIDKESGVELKAVCVTKPEIEISDYKGIKAPKEVKEITDEDIEKQIEIIRKKNARIVSVDDRAAQMDDEVVIDFEGFFGDEAFEGGKGEDHPLRLGSGQFIPGFEDQIVGHNIGDEFDVNVTFPEDYQMSDYAGKEATFKCKLKSISYEELPEINDDLVKDATEFDTVAEYKDDIKTKLEEAAVSQADSAFENAVMTALIDKVDAPIPNCMYEQRIDALMRSFEQQLAQQGMDLKLYFQYTGMDMDSFRETYRDRAVSEVKLRLALEKIADLENIEISEEELNNGLGEIAAANNIDVETVKQFIPLDEYTTDLRVQKAVELVKENAVVDNTVAEEKAE